MAEILIVYSKAGLIYLDEKCDVRMQQGLWEDENELYLDEELKTKLQIIPLDDVPLRTRSKATTPPPDPDTIATFLLTLEDSHAREEHESAKSTVDESQTHEKHEIWTKDETMFLINLMQEHVDSESELPKSIADLEARIRTGRGKQKQLWAEFTKKLGDAFKREFDAKRISRKWQTLMDALKKSNLNNSTTGKGPTKFVYWKEMNELFGNRHDVNFVVSATAEKVTVHRPTELSAAESNEARAERAPGCSASHSDAKVLSRKRKNKNRSSGDEFLKYMRESDAEMASRNDEMLQRMDRFQNTFEQMMGKMLDKL